MSKRVFGTFLSWLQDRQGDVFVIATSNDIAQLPPEFIRKGRFDEVFFVDLPKPEAREEIFRIHLRKRNQDPTRFELKVLAEATDGFSGAEIEQVVVGALYGAFTNGGGPDDDAAPGRGRGDPPPLRDDVGEDQRAAGLGGHPDRGGRLNPSAGTPVESPASAVS